MANKLEVYKVQDTETGKIIQVEGPAGATDEELYSFLSEQQSQPSQAPTPTQTAEPVAPQGTVAISDANPEPVSAGQGQQVTTQLQRGYTSDAQKADPKFLGEDDEATSFLVDMARTGKTYEEVNEAVRAKAQETGMALPRDAFVGGKPAWEQYVKDLEANDWVSSPAEYSASKDFMMPENIQGTAQSDNAFVRGLQQGAAEGGAGLLGMAWVDMTDGNKDRIREMFPGATDDQLETITDEYNNELMRRVRGANAEATKDDNLAVNIGGQALGGVGVEDALPMWAARSALGRVATAGGMNTAVDLGYQAHDIQRGIQSEFDTQRAFLAPAIGVAFQGALEAPLGIARRVARNNQIEAEVTPRGSGSPAVRVPTNRKGSKAYKVQLAESTSDIVDQVNKATAGWQDAPDITVHDRFTDLKGVDNNAIGVYLGADPETGRPRVAINTENVLKEAKRLRVNPEDIVNSVTFHESLGHYGLAKEYGDRLDDVLMDFYDNSTSGSFRDDVDAWLEKRPEAYADSDNRLARGAEEVLAEMANNGQIPVRLADKLINTVKDFMRKLGMDLKISPRELRSYVALSQARVGKKQRFATSRVDEIAPQGEPRYMYLGEGAETANLSTLERIKEDRDFDRMSGVGKADLIDDYGPGSKTRQETGWFLAPDGRWRFEIDDNSSTFNGLGYRESMSEDELSFIEALSENHDVPMYEVAGDLENRDLFDIMGTKEIAKKYNIELLELRDVLQHDTLLRAYPELGDVKITRDPSRAYGAFYPDKNLINVAPDAPNPRGVLMHEIQHWVQDREGHASGGSPDSALKDAPDELILKGTANLVAHRRAGIKKMSNLADVIEKVYSDPMSRELYNMNNEIQKLSDRASQLEKRGHPNAAEARKKHYELFRDADKLSDALFEKHFGITYREVALNEEHRGLLNEWVKLNSMIHGADKFYRRKPSVRIHEYNQSINSRIKEATSLIKLLDNKDAEGLRQVLRNDNDAKFSVYEHLFGEVEARDTQNRYDFINEDGVGADGPDVRAYNEPYTSEADRIEPDDYIFAYDEPLAASEPRNMMPKPLEDVEGDPSAVSQNDLFEMGTARGILAGALDGYEPSVRSWDEVKAAARNSGLNSGHIRSSKGVGDLDKKLFQYDKVAQAMSERVAELGVAIQRGDYSKKGEYLETIFKFNEVVGRLWDDQAQVARALNAMKMIESTKRRYGEMARVLDEYESGNPLAAFADDKVFARFANQMNQLVASGNTAGAGSMASQVVKPYWWQYILSFRHAMMLSGLGTHAKNAMDNSLMIARELEETAMAALVDPFRKGAQKAGFDVQDGVSAQEVAGRTYGIFKALLDSGTYLNAVKAFKEGHGSTPYSAKIEMQDAYVPGIGKINNALFAADTFFRAFHKSANLHALGVRQARAEGFKGTRLFEEGSARATNPNEEMIDAAQKKADEALLVDTPSGWIAKAEAFKAISPGMKGADQAMAFTANMLMPFFRVTDRLLFQVIRRSPLSFLDKNTRAAFRAGGAERDIAMARTVYGTALMAYYWQSAGDEEGGIVGETTKDYRKLQALEAGGFKPNSIREDGQYVDATALNLSFFPWETQNNVAANVASIREAWEKGKADEDDTVEALGMASKALLTFLASQSYAENLSNYLELATARTDEGQNVAAANFVGSTASQFVPAAARQANQQVLDPVKRDTRGDKSFGDRVYGRVASGIPGLSQTLPTKYDLYGDVIPQGRTTLSMDNYATIKTDPVSVELQKLERTQDSAVVSGFRGSFTHNGENIKLPADAIQEWNRVQGYYLREWMKDEISSPEWKQMSNEEKIEVVKDVKKEAQQVTKEYMLPLLGLEENDDE